uniref:Mitochondrial outer membrane protein porin 4 n=1 Tax=Rhizophora mucronata TaxID=61149 RepID=A0A2P2LD50_RHIMU
MHFVFLGIFSFAMRYKEFNLVCPFLLPKKFFSLCIRMWAMLSMPGMYEYFSVLFIISFPGFLAAVFIQVSKICSILCSA